jgi:hypothetical protein
VGEIHKLHKNFYSPLVGVAILLMFLSSSWAGGGLVLEDDACILRIDFYSAHFTAYQPDSSGNEQFCESLPNKGSTIFVLDYLHQSLKEVPVDFRIIRDVTELGRFVKLKHVQAIEDIDQHTVFYQPPVIQADASLQIEHDFLEDGEYIGIVSAGHPTTDASYTAVFPFEVGGSNPYYPIALFIGLAGAGLLLLRRRHKSAISSESTAGSGGTPS